MPLVLWRKTVKQIAQQNLKHLAPLSRLLKEPEFLAAFHSFLKSEFSAESLYFWTETDRLLRTYESLLPVDLVYEIGVCINPPVPIHTVFGAVDLFALP